MRKAETEVDLDLTERLRTVVAKISRRLQRTRAGAALTSTETTVLSTTVRCGPVGLTQLAKQEGMNPTMLSRVIRSLEDAGLIIRRGDPLDGRAALVEATPQGKRLQQQIRSERDDAINLYAKELPINDRDTLSAALPILEALAEHLKDR